MAETLIPTCSFRWFVDYDGERILQQRFQTTGYQDRWISVPEVSFHDDDSKLHGAPEGEANG